MRISFLLRLTAIPFALMSFLAILLYVVPNLLLFLLPEFEFSEAYSGVLPERTLVLASVFISGAIGIVVSIVTGTIRFDTLFTKSTEDKIAYLISAYFSVVVTQKTFRIGSDDSLFIFTILFLFFLFFTPLFIDFLHENLRLLHDIFTDIWRKVLLPTGKTLINQIRSQRIPQPRVVRPIINMSHVHIPFISKIIIRPIINMPHVHIPLFISRIKERILVFSRYRVSMVTVLTVLTVLSIAIIGITYFGVKSIIYVDKIIWEANHQRIRKSLNPEITKIEPAIAYHSTKIVMYGRGFDWPGVNKVQLRDHDGKIEPDLWTDTKIIFSIPLQTKLGPHSIWIEKDVSWDGQTIVVKSNEVTLRVIRRLPLEWNADDDAYFKHLEMLGDEALEINGYSPEDF